MALSGNWRSSVATEAQVRNNLGTGWNPIHAVRSGDGRNIASNTGGASTLADVIPYGETDHGGDYYSDDPAGSDTLAAQAFDDTDHIVWGYSPDDGTADRPGWDVTTPEFRDNSQLPSPAWPEWGPYTNGIPGGTIIRDENRGATNTKLIKERPSETVSEGWENKRYMDAPLDPDLPDPSQLIMQTSMMQRDLTRDGSQVRSGRENEDRAPIRSRIVGPRLKIWSDSFARRYDMTPRSAEERIRPWWTRTAGTADPSMMDPNSMRVREPVSRTVPAEPFQGDSTPVSSTGQTDSADYGYVSEDVIPYA